MQRPASLLFRRFWIFAAILPSITVVAPVSSSASPACPSNTMSGVGSMTKPGKSGHGVVSACTAVSR